MALFGVPSATELDAANTLHCAIDMIDELARWNAKRIKAGRSPIKVAVSANYGTAVLGDIGTRESTTFTAIGDTLNIASRMQGLCRSLDTQLVVTQSLAARAGEECGGKLPILSRLSDGGLHPLQGVTLPVQVWKCD